MDRRIADMTVRSLIVATVFALVGAVVWTLGSIRREATRQVVRTALWPRPDGSVRSYGEVWDYASPETRPVV